jgi:hypothetical protein
VTDANGKLIEDDELAQEILDDFSALAEESDTEEPASEPSEKEKQ